MLVASYNAFIVVISVLVAMLASFTALDMAGRVATSTGKVALVWLLGGGFAMGIGIWAMHFIGMLSMDLDMMMSYDARLTALSAGIAVCASIFALWLVCHGELPLPRLAGGAIVLGSGIVAMHYTGMAALMLSQGIVWNWGWVLISVIIALAASVAALWLAFKLREGHEGRVATLRVCASVVMGAAIAGMHYTGMMAAEFPAGSHSMDAGVNSNWLAMVVTVVTLAILGITLLVSMLDARMQARTSILASSLAEANRELASWRCTIT